MIEFKEQDWGVRLNEKNYCKFDLDAPDWAKDLPTLSWYFEGLVVWDEIQEIAVNLNYWYAMELLDNLKEDQNWKAQGHNLYEQYIQIEIDVKRKKRKQSDIQEDQPGSKNETVTIELHLPPDRVDKLLTQTPYSDLKP